MTICCRCRKEIVGGENWYGLHKDCFVDWFGLSEPVEFSDIKPRSQSIPQEDRGKNTSFFHGTFRKFSSRLGPHEYILKVLQKDHPELPPTEFLCNQIYENLGLEVPAYYLVRYPSKGLCFVSKNFMSKISSASLVHIYHYLTDSDEFNCENIVKLIGEKTGRRIEQERFVCLTLADSLTGNHDRHGRNLAFIQRASGMQLAPFYDNPSYVGLDDDLMLGADLQPRGAIFTDGSDEPTMKDYVCEWKRLGYDEVVRGFYERVSLEKLENIIKGSFISKKRKKALLCLVKKRYEELCKA